jgi:hypothetical protein|tara:strand:- start:3101 stop:3430 length:330 start_codon:yes stop_codon:yes gene_type:complete
MAERLKVRYVEGTPHVQSLEHGAAGKVIGVAYDSERQDWAILEVEGEDGWPSYDDIHEHDAPFMTVYLTDGTVFREVSVVRDTYGVCICPVIVQPSAPPGAFPCNSPSA